MKKQIGIWLDYKEALIIELTEEKALTTSIPSEIEDFHPKGGARSKTNWGPMDKISERTYLERRKHQEKNYFQNLIKTVRKADELFVFGPAQAKDKFIQVIINSTGMHPALKGSEKTDSMTDNQKIAKVKAFFKK